MKETLKQAGYRYISYIGNSEHVLQSPSGKLEVFHPNKNFAGWGLIYKNTHLEFCCSFN